MGETPSPTVIILFSRSPNQRLSTVHRSINQSRLALIGTKALELTA